VYSSHALIAMLCIAKAAETPQNYSDVYFAVRNIAEAIQSGSTGAAQNTPGILREVAFARGEMPEAEAEDHAFFIA
jgi:hypothetical protein